VRTDTIGHDAYLEVAAEMGIPQLVIFLGIVLFSYRSLEQTRRKVQPSGPKLLYDAALGLEAGLVGYAVGALTISAEYQKLFWLVLCLSMCLPALARNMVPAAEEVPLRGLGSALGRTPARALSGEPSGKVGSTTRQPSISDEGLATTVRNQGSLI
jgi:hypothetical protein